ncbi:hypothetical protein DFW101_2557 [Solidesulfovibrio carbinoliphilus subsp. oakridgensis]|uniref:Spore protein YkvP/CgeB glycosyl transferase-like domain-containing protein n=1 Tax=Solidesulfovibrio carbinoliphilus subsp. oakridgensis TaxID=694327 RepID=G7Q8E9_9BACT|nr:glycosyltransferase [Solidesulfovibrio carbinoliphilus]EHJ48561.1 hypothetical protein DFW101_2557 [Solidesulfovibrio carbinoliphilus subsp. oakridgensis]
MRIVNLHNTAFVATFRKRGHDVLSIGTTPDCDVRLDEPLSCKRLLDLLAAKGFRPDLAFWCDGCQTPWIFGLETLPAVTIGFSIDQYMHPWHVPYSAAFDAFFVAQKDYLPLFAETPTGRPAVWMPLFCDPGRDRDPGVARDIPVSFVGTLDGAVNAGRRPFLAAFRKLAPLYATTGRYQPVFGRSRIVLNQSAAGELNFRLFEAMACGAAVLTEATGNGLAELFTPGRDILTYRRGDPAQAAATALAALADPGLPTLAAAGRRAVLSGHTVTARARLVLDTAVARAAAGAPGERLARLPAVRAAVAKAYAMLATDERLPLAEGERRFFLGMAR